MQKQYRPQLTSPFPGGSKTRVNKAGENVRAGTQNSEDLMVIEEWRAAHRVVLNTFQAILRVRARGKEVIVAQRHKRKRTVFGKLLRLPHMKLSRMDDVAGCRVIFRSIKDLYQFRQRFHKARFRHKRRHDSNPDKYNYIKSPKSSGYRGVHDIYEYDVNSAVGKTFAGLNVEIQYRTLVQHAWATAVEIIGFVTESQPKFQMGDCKIWHAMALASEILARVHEKEKGCFPEIADRALVSEFLTTEKDLNLLKMFRDLNATQSVVSNKSHQILIFADGKALELKSYTYATDALRALFDLENQYPERDMVLVRTDKSDDIRIAFKSYFTDASDFLHLLENACEKLSNTTNILDVYGERRKNKKTP